MINEEAETSTADIEQATMRRVTVRLLPFLMVCYFFALLDRVNVGFAALQMNKDLGLTTAVFGFGASLYFVTYFLFEVPSNLALEKFGARKWIARIMITWGLISASMSFVTGVHSFYVMRLLLGAAEAGFFPGVVLFLTYWLPPAYRARFIAMFMVSIPVASFLGSPLSASLLGLDGLFGLRGWQWLFLVEGIPATLLGISCYFFLTDRPSEAKWLTDEQRNWLVDHIATVNKRKTNVGKLSIWQLLRNKYFLLMTLACAGASSTGTVLSIWQPQMLKAFGLTIMQTGLINSIPYGIASVLMILWGRHSDRTNERRWHTALTLFLMAFGLGSMFLAQGMLALTVLLCACALVGAYSFKGPFWTLSSGWMAPETLAAGLAGINALSNLTGGGMISLVGLIKQATGSFAMGFLPVVALTAVGGLGILWISREKKSTQALATGITEK